MPEPCFYAIVSVSILDQYICFWVSSLPGLFVGLLQSGVTSGHLSTSMQSSQPRHTAGAKATARLLGCCGFLLPTQLCFLKQFALPKANFGWVARGPTWTVASSLWATFWVSTRRVRYSSPWLRALFLGGSLHLDVAWVTRLAAAVLRARFRSCDPSWSNHGGTCSGALRSWFRSHDFTSVLGSGVIPLPLSRSTFLSVLVPNAGASYWSCSTKCLGRLEGPVIVLL